ncbi:CHASE domain-containing sensor histidine kinase [Simiduia agarivorans]|uniref:histidine kinase n=1 Tax=Simiduia agarivorans (strain DSM 21679 / JCM 13881 / BCRC 17597 / SA1) TaxID=1117647 RepID=K4KJ54_SIMAS|nr:CHASE domain-containing protein [Simiduia agarivorans]AFU99149.1 sensory box histidine kinase [Simiduia agarivorans SA1 = DSM 21679]
MSTFLHALGAKPPWLVLLVSLLVSAFATYITQQETNRASQEAFERRLEKLTFDIYHHLDTYVSTLRAGVGLFNASEHVSREEFGEFVETLDIDRFYPGIQGIGYAAMVSSTDLKGYEKDLVTQGFPGFMVSPPGHRDWYVPVTYLEPFDWRNQRAFGYDMYSEPVRRAAMDRAISSGEASASGIVTLVQETKEDVQLGFLLYLPVWADNARLGDKPQGFVYAPFRMKKLMQGALGEHWPDLVFHIEDVSDEPATLYASVPPLSSGRFFGESQLAFAGRSWRLTARSTPAFDSEAGGSAPWLVLAVGLLDSLLLFVMALTLVSHRRSAQLHAVKSQEQLFLAQKFQQMADLAPTGLLLVSETGEVCLHNREAARLSGYEDELVNKNVADLLPVVSGGVGLERSASDGALHCRGGRTVPVEVRHTSLTVNQVPFEVYTLIDIRQRLRQESLLKQRTEALERFVYAVSHDLKSPLVAIAGLVDLVIHQLPANGMEDSRQLLARVVRNCKQMEGLLNDLLALSRIGHQQLPVESFSLPALVDELVLIYRPQLRDLGGKLELVLSCEVFSGYRTLVRQLLDNLLANAVKYRSQVQSPIVRLSIAQTQEGVTISVADNGPGVREADRQRVFDLFVRAHTSGEGSGVGLAICRSICERHQGDIWVETSDMGGAQFVAHLHSVSDSDGSNA